MPGDEVVDAVDEDDRVVGKATLADCLNEGLLHRTVGVIVSRTNGRVILQRRSREDLWHPGLWTLSSTGHVKKGESRTKAARRELLEELGLRGKLVHLSKILLPAIRSRGMTEREWVSVYGTQTNAEVKINPVEVDSVQEFTSQELRRMLSGHRLTPDARIILRAYLDGKIPSATAPMKKIR
ncbi:MAG: NUDIX domain-containing protein [Thaumarchaeota archaeon]|nr:NUDIX domain-containing protein [Nitrososphaerota archaeon]